MFAQDIGPMACREIIKMKARGLILKISGIILLMLIIAILLNHELDIDDCHDRGGRWDHALSRCDN